MSASKKIDRPFGVAALYEHHADMCKVFSHPVRLMILNILRESEKNVAEIAGALEIPLGTVSPHLLMMKRRRVLCSRREGTQIFYRLAHPRILDAFDLIQKILCERLIEEGSLASHAKIKR
ncbi:MAG: transcriptional regulator [Deltaproteobacteria bacterium CG11_big_fil_rev_8_21_14_0_20_49_13]|nr:MAG: transcriptional regulator [Deltaproteobacteria bacterium CG11_big_fil_rev_8_21_14_0_20_49_13]